MNNTAIDLPTFWQTFVQIEQRTNILKRRFGTVQLYALQRTKIFYALAEAVGLFDNPHPHFSKPKPQNEQPVELDFKLLKPSANVVVPFRRRVGSLEPYSERISDIVAASGGVVATLDFAVRDQIAVRSRTGETFGLEDLDIESLRVAFAWQYRERVERIMRFTSRRPQANSWRNLISQFETAFHVKLDKFAKYPQWLVRRTLAEQFGFEALFRAAKTQKLFIVNAYSEPTIVLGAKRAGAKVYEIQHGFISKFHPAYSFANRRAPKIDASPDEILTWGKAWGLGLQLSKHTKLRVTGPTKSFTDCLSSPPSVRVPLRILFTSQGAIAKELFGAAIRAALTLPNHEVIYRLHPNEALSDYEALLNTYSKKPKNLTLSHQSPSFLDLVCSSEYLIGGFSTTLYEGMALGCKVLVLKVPGYENMLDAIERNDATLITDLDSLAETLLNAQKAANPEIYYAKDAHAKLA